MRRPCQQALEEELSVGQRRQFAHVGDALGEVDHCGAAAQLGLQAGRCLPACVVVVEGQEDPGAAPERRRHLVHPLGAQGGAGRVAPRRQRQVVEDPFGQDCEGLNLVPCMAGIKR